MTSLDRPVGEGDGAPLGELVAAETLPPEEELTVNLGEETLHRALEDLPERERDVLKLRYGLNGDPDPQSLAEIGRRMRISRERVRQLESEALGRLAVHRELEAVRG